MEAEETGEIEEAQEEATEEAQEEEAAEAIVVLQVEIRVIIADLLVVIRQGETVLHTTGSAINAISMGILPLYVEMVDKEEAVEVHVDMVNREDKDFTEDPTEDHTRMAEAPTSVEHKKMMNRIKKKMTVPQISSTKPSVISE